MNIRTESVAKNSRQLEIADEANRVRAAAGQSYAFSHQLNHHPLLTLANVRQIARDLLQQDRQNQIFFATEMKGENSSFDNARRPEELEGCFDSLEEAAAWIRLTQIDTVLPEVNEIIGELYDDLSALHGIDLRACAFGHYVTLFISSPGTRTPYHFDHTWNFLFQVLGRKSVRLYDPDDSAVLGPEAREQHYVGNMIDSAMEKQVTPDVVYDLEPGQGAHHPVNAPHSVQNGDEISISLSVGFCLHESNRLARVHQMNYLLRRLGLTPPRPGLAPALDSLKSGTLGLFADRNPQDFDAAVYSGWRRFRRWSGLAALEHLNKRRARHGVAAGRKG